MKIDSYCHIMPRAFAQDFQAAIRAEGREFPLWALDDLADVDRRVAMMDALGIDKQVVALGALPIDDMITDSEKAAALARLANEGIVELTSRYPGRFIPVATITQSDLGHAVEEAEYCLDSLGMKGVQLHSNARGRPIDRREYRPFYSMLAQRKAPIWLHPTRHLDRPDYVDEERSELDAAFVVGWAYDTTLAMLRLIFSGLFEELPDIRIIAHHAGALVPLLAHRFAHAYGPDRISHYPYRKWESGEQCVLQRPILDYFRMFYTDTVSHASPMAIRGAYDFYGPARLLFGSDAPFDFQGGRSFVSSHLQVLAELELPEEHLEMIHSGNILRLLEEEERASVR